MPLEIPYPGNSPKTFVFPGGSQESYDYDANGNLIKITNRAGGKIAYTYDDVNRITKRKYEETSGPETTFDYSYDDANRLTGITRKQGTTTESTTSVSFNAANQITAITADGHMTGYAYNTAQQLNQITYPSGEVVRYDYDSRGSISAIKEGSNAIIASYTKDDAGRIIKRTHANGLETVYVWNDADWMTKLELREIANPTNVIQSFEYGYDAIGNRLWTKTKDGRGDVYKYDATYQVIGVKYNVNDPTVGYDAATNAARIVTYQYDAVGNRTSVTDNGNPTSYTVNALNQYTQVGGNSGYTYNARGDLTGDGTWTYGYDREGRLISANKTGTAVTYTYDSIGRRIQKNVNGTITKYVYNGYDLIEERDGSNIVTAKYIYEEGIDRPVKVILGSNELYFQQDALGNVTALTDHTGFMVEQYSYDIFGVPTILDGAGMPKSSPMTPFLFTGREFDAETGLYHYRSRSYSGELGRYLQVDSIGFEGTDINLYRYTENNPINYRDPMGFSKTDVDCYTDFQNATKGLFVEKVGSVIKGSVWGLLGAVAGFATFGAVTTLTANPVAGGAASLAVGGGVAAYGIGSAVADIKDLNRRAEEAEEELRRCLECSIQ